MFEMRLLRPDTIIYNSAQVQAIGKGQFAFSGRPVDEVRRLCALAGPRTEERVQNIQTRARRITDRGVTAGALVCAARQGRGIQSDEAKQ